TDSGGDGHGILLPFTEWNRGSDAMFGGQTRERATPYYTMASPVDPMKQTWPFPLPVSSHLLLARLELGDRGGLELDLRRLLGHVTRSGAHHPARRSHPGSAARHHAATRHHSATGHHSAAAHPG